MAVSGRRIKVQTILDAIPDSGGNLTLIARRANCHRDTIHNMIKRHDSVKAAIELEQEETIDALENKALKLALEENDKTMIIFILKNSREGKRRGWGERQEITGKDSDPIQVEDVTDTRAKLATLLNRGAARTGANGDSVQANGQGD